VIKREACSDWPKIMCPAPGCMPPVGPERKWERVLHLSASNAIDPQTGLVRALSSCASVYRSINWRQMAYARNWTGTDSQLVAEIMRIATRIRPTLVWMQIQRDGVISAKDIERLRLLCDPRTGVIVNWDGDQHYEPQMPQRGWFVRLGRVCDTSLVVNTKHPAEYAVWGVRHPGFWGVGFDEHIWKPMTPRPEGITPIILLANYWAHITSAYNNRLMLMNTVSQAFPGKFTVYGSGWESYRGAPWKPFLANEEEARVYSGAKASLSISIRSDLPRYTSNRLVYALGCGALVLVEKFADCEGFGLEHGKNCLLFDGPDELVRICRWVLAEASTDELERIREGAAALGAQHSWQAHMPELFAIVDAVRASR